MSVSLLLIHAAIYCGLITAALFVLGLKGPRPMLQDYPRSIQDATTPKTPVEKKQGVILAIPFLVIFIGYPPWVGFHLATTGTHYWDTFFYVYGLMFIGNLYDLIVLDWIMFCTITPKMVVIPGTEGNKGYKDYYFHFIGFLKGLVITLTLSFALTAIVQLIS